MEEKYLTKEGLENLKKELDILRRKVELKFLKN
jgi:hypothetical protein